MHLVPLSEGRPASASVSRRRTCDVTAEQPEHGVANTAQGVAVAEQAQGVAGPRAAGRSPRGSRHLPSSEVLCQLLAQHGDPPASACDAEQRAQSGAG